MKQLAPFLLSVIALAAGCTRPTTSSQNAPDAAPPPAPAVGQRGWGSVMVEVGHRFETAGRAAAAKRFELAAFEADELQELFDRDLPQAELPKEGPTNTLVGMADAFGKTHPIALGKAANAKDAHAFAEAFQAAAAACNGCHRTSGHGFIVVPSIPGKSVPDLDPVTVP